MEKKIIALIKGAEKLREGARYREALKAFDKALTLSRLHNNLDGVLDSTLSLADIYRMTGDFDRAIKNYEEALEACEALGNRLTAADCMVGMGLSLRAIGMWKEAIRFIKAARKTYTKEKDDKGIAFSLWAEAGALRVAGDIKSAIAKFREAKTLFASVKFRPGIAYSLCGLGGAHRIAGKYRDSLKYYEQANSMFTALGDKFGTAYSHCGIGNANRMVGDYTDAVKHFRAATRLYEGIGDIVSYSYTLWSFATVYKMKKDFAKARQHIRTAYANFRKTKDPRGIIYCDLALGEMELMEGKKAAAEKKFLRALENCEKHNFKLERCHAMFFLRLVRGLPPQADLCYKKLGVDIGLPSVPFNMQ